MASLTSTEFQALLREQFAASKRRGAYRVFNTGRSAYGHNTYRVFAGDGTYLGEVNGGGTPTIGASRWWKANTSNGRSDRYCRDMTDALRTLHVLYVAAKAS
jgi:hypothetical protein